MVWRAAGWEGNVCTAESIAFPSANLTLSLLQYSSPLYAFLQVPPASPLLLLLSLSSPLGSEMSDGNLPGKSSPSPSPSPCFGAELSTPCRDLILNSASPHPYLPEEVEAAICIFIKHCLAGYTRCIATSRSWGRPAGRQDRKISQRCITAP